MPSPVLASPDDHLQTVQRLGTHSAILSKASQTSPRDLHSLSVSHGLSIIGKQGCGVVPGASSATVMTQERPKVNTGSWTGPKSCKVTPSPERLLHLQSGVGVHRTLGLPVAASCCHLLRTPWPLGTATLELGRIVGGQWALTPASAVCRPSDVTWQEGRPA